MSNLKRLPDGRYAVSPCPICGKEKPLAPIVNVGQYLYKDHFRHCDVYYCSYTCWIRADKAAKEKKAKKQAAKSTAPTARKQRELGSAAVQRLQEERRRNIFELGKAFWHDWTVNNLTQPEIAAKYSKSLSFVKKYINLYREAMA